MVQIHILDDFVGVNFDVFGVNLHFVGCALVGTNFLSGVGGGIWSFWVVEKGAHGFWEILGHWIAKKMRYIAISAQAEISQDRRRPRAFLAACSATMARHRLSGPAM